MSDIADWSCARLNNATHATVDMDDVFAEGAFKLVYEGTYTKGARAGEACVCKVFKDGPKYSASFFRHEIDVVEKAVEIIEKFNDLDMLGGKEVKLNIPEVWTFDETCSKAGERAILEPYIEDFEKFNSNTGWKARSNVPWHLVMQALSHYSYHATGGTYVLCDLQGGYYSNGVVLTDPVVMSRAQVFGPTDLGADGIVTFFARHKCNKFCDSDWTRPADRRPRLDIRRGTSMRVVPTVKGRPPMSQARCF